MSTNKISRATHKEKGADRQSPLVHKSISVIWSRTFYYKWSVSRQAIFLILTAAVVVNFTSGVCEGFSAQMAYSSLSPTFPAYSVYLPFMSFWVIVNNRTGTIVFYFPPCFFKLLLMWRLLLMLGLHGLAWHYSQLWATNDSWQIVSNFMWIYMTVYVEQGVTEV